MSTIEVRGRLEERWQREVLTNEALQFVAALQQRFGARRESLLEKRKQRQMRLDAGELPNFLPETRSIREGKWQVAEVPEDLNDRRVEITGPVEAKMMINALNSGAKVFMADFEDSLSPTWNNVVEGQLNLKQAVRRTLQYQSDAGKLYQLQANLATLVVRPRGWHLIEKHALFEGHPVSASLFDFGLYFFHNAAETLKRGTGPYFYLPKLESHLEARLWNDVFHFAQDYCQIPRGSIRATVLIETIMAAFEMEEILFELKEHIAGLNAGRWDYIFSIIKKLSRYEDKILPDRAQVTMTVPFMRAYTDQIVRVCHKRGAHAIGGMSAFIPSRKDLKVNEVALSKVVEDKRREADDGFDGTWVAHPDLVPVAKQIFDDVLQLNPNQKSRQKLGSHVEASDLLNLHIEGGKITEAGFTNNISVAMQYLDCWLGGLGAAALYNLMEDAATAEIARAQLWQWIKHGARFDDGRLINAALYRRIRDEELMRLRQQGYTRLQYAVEILDGLVLADEMTDFLTVPAYQYID